VAIITRDLRVFVNLLAHGHTKSLNPGPRPFLSDPEKFSRENISVRVAILVADCYSARVPNFFLNHLHSIC